MDLTEARRLEAAATTGPWMFAHLPDKEWPNFEWYVWGAPSAVSVGDATSEANAAFIAYMRNNATDYFDAVEQRDQLREALERILSHTIRHQNDAEADYPGGVHFAQYAAEVVEEAMRRLQGEAAR